MKKIVSILAVLAVIGFCQQNSSICVAKSNDSTKLQASVQEGQESATLYTSRASDRFMKKDINGAIDDMSKAISIEPTNTMHYLNRGFLKQVLNDLSGAMDDYNSALKINPNFAPAYNNRGVVRAAQKDIQGAMEDYAKALSISPKYSDVYYNRGNLKYMLSDNEGALADYDKAIEYNPKDAEAYNNRGVVKKRMNFNVGALSDYSQAIALNPKDSIAYANRGRLKKLYFDNEGAAIDLNQAIALAENQTFIKNVKPLVSNDRYIASLPIINGITEDNPELIKIPPKENEKLAEKLPPKNFTIPKSAKKSIAYSYVPKADGTKLALASPAGGIQDLKPVKEKTVDKKGSTTTLSVGIGTVKAIEPPDIRTSSVTKTPTTNVKLAESYYIRGLQKCVLRDLKGAVADLDKAIANNEKYADAYFYRAAIRRELGDLDGFKKDYATAIQINPTLQAFNDANALGLVRG